MQNLLYITQSYEDYSKKITGQLDALRNYGYNTYVCTYLSQRSGYAFFRLEQDHFTETLDFYKGVRSGTAFVKYINYIIKQYDFDVFYFRRLGISVLLYGKLMKSMHKNHKMIFYEIPTYPLQRPSQVAQLTANFVEDLFLKRKIIPYIDWLPACVRIAGYSLPEKMIPIRNCVNYKEYEKFLSVPIPEYDRKHMKFLAVAHTQYWHGYDRLIRAMSLWEGSAKLELTIFGNFTKETTKLKQMCSELNMENIYFYEEKDIENYAEFIGEYHIAVGCLGIDRCMKKGEKGMELDTSIKNKEYCAMGIPFIHSSIDEAFDVDFPYHFLVDKGEDNQVNIDDILNWYGTLHLCSRKIMWNYAKDKLSYEYYVKSMADSIHKKEISVNAI